MQRNQAREFVHRLPRQAFLGRVIGLERHIEHPHADQHSEWGSHPAVIAAVHDADQYAENDYMHQTLDVLAVVDGAHSGNESQQKRDSWRRTHVRYRRRRWRRVGRIASSGRRARRGWSWSRHVFLTVDGSGKHSPGALAQRLATGSAIQIGRCFWMI